MTLPLKHQTEDDSAFELPDSLRPPKDARLWIGGHNTLLRGQLDRQLNDNPRPATGPIDWAIITPQTHDEALYFVVKVKPRVTSCGTILVLLTQVNRNSSNSGPGLDGLAPQLEDLDLELSSETCSTNSGLIGALRLQVR